MNAGAGEMWRGGSDAGGAAAPVVAAHDGAGDVERVHQLDHVGSDRPLLAGSWGGSVEEPCRAVASPSGIKGLGEVGIVGVAAAIANAVYHATGRRIRSLPITIDDLQ
jgi:hypothetical protein